MKALFLALPSLDFFVEITENNCEGLVRMQDLTDDYYEYDRENYRIVGQRHKKMYTFGDAVVVRLKETNLARRSMDFALVSNKAERISADSGSGRLGKRTESHRSGSGSSRETSSSRRSSTNKRNEGPAAKGENRRGGRGRR